MLSRPAIAASSSPLLSDNLIQGKDWMGNLLLQAGRTPHDVVPCPRFFAILGYSAVSFSILAILLELASFVGLGVYHAFLFSSILSRPQYQAIFGHCRGLDGKCS